PPEPAADVPPSPGFSSSMPRIDAHDGTKKASATTPAHASANFTLPRNISEPSTHEDAGRTQADRHFRLTLRSLGRREPEHGGTREPHDAYGESHRGDRGLVARVVAELDGSGRAVDVLGTLGVGVAPRRFRL